MTNHFKLKLFGRFELHRNQMPVMDMQALKAQALLSYLAVTGHPHSRSALAGLLWGGMPEVKARGNLSKTLSTLRRALGDHLAITRQTIAFEPGDGFWLDVAEFEAGAQTNDIDCLQEAIQLYEGDFLTGFYVRNAPEFEDWLLAQQARFKALALQALHTLAIHFRSQGEGGRQEAIRYITDLLRLEPWREEAHCQLMELLAQNGQRTAALNQYETCRQVLQDELGVAPSAATEALYQRLKAQSSINSNPAKPHFVTTTDYTLVGRDAEWMTLRTQWQHLTRPHFVCISGEAGIGKTRLAEELVMLAERESHHVSRTRSHALEGRLAYGPVADWLRTDPLKSNLAKLDNIWLTEIARILPEVLIEHPTLPHPEPLKDSWQRKRLLEALGQAFTQRHSRLLLVIDDLQWCDKDTLEWLQYLLESAQFPLLVVGTVRTDEINDDHPLRPVQGQLSLRDKLSEIPLTPLTQDAVAELSAQVTTQSTYDEQSLFHDTAGNPLFVIESARAAQRNTVTMVATLSHSADRDLNQREVSIPPKMYSVIQSRLSNLSPGAIDVAQVGATIGRSFDIALLAQAAQLNEETIRHHLDELWQRRLIRQVDALHFDFSHDRIRDVAYAEISPITRPLLHQKVATALETLHEDNLDNIYGELAAHCEYAGLLEKAVDYHNQAANVARRLFAHQKALYHRQKALYVLEKLSSSVEKQALEIEILTDLGRDQVYVNGFGHHLSGDAWLKAYNLAVKMESPIYQIKTAISLSSYYRMRSNWQRSQVFAQQAVSLASELDAQDLLSRANMGVAVNNMHLGYLENANLCFQKIWETSSINDQDPVVWARHGHCLWLLGLPQQAYQRVTESYQVKVYEQKQLPMLLSHNAMILVFCRDISGLEALLTRFTDICLKQDNQFFLRNARIYQGWLMAHQGEPSNGAALIQENNNEHRIRGDQIFDVLYGSLLIEAYLLAFEPELAIAEVEEMLLFADETGNCYWNAQLLKLKGDCLQTMAYTDTEVEACYQQAIDIARAQSSRSLELRATTSLCRLWQKQNKITEAHQLLTAIYGWFTEGFDTVDLQEAKTLLTELARTQTDSGILHR